MCSAGVCEEVFETQCVQPANECEEALCNDQTGACEVHVWDGEVCAEDDALCTGGSMCQNATCTPLFPVECPEPWTDKCQLERFCDSGSGECVILPQPDTFPCDDGDALSQNDMCMDGECLGQPVMCSGALNDTCTLPDEDCREGVCVYEPSATCDAGFCSNAGDFACTEDESCFYRCDVVLRADGTPCDADDLCSASTCWQGECVAETLVECPTSDDPCVDELACEHTTGQCEPVLKAEGAECGEANCAPLQCTAEGECEAGAPVDCSELDSACTLGVCDSELGECVAQAINVGQACPDADCEVDSECSADGECVGAPLCEVESFECEVATCLNDTCSYETAPNGQICATGTHPCHPGTLAARHRSLRSR